MVLKCSKEQFEALHKLFAHIMQQKPNSIADSLAKELMKPIYTKLDNRVNSIMDGKRGWNLTVTPLQAKAYYLFFKEVDISKSWQYEHYIIQKHLQEINKVFA